MRLACSLLVAALSAACGSSTDPRMVLPGGDDTTTGPGPDASTIGDGAVGDGAGILGRVCVVADLRVLDTTGCAGSGVDGLTVTLGTDTATTAADGSFTIAQPSGTNLIWQVTGPGLVTSLIPFSVSSLLPAVTQDFYDDLTISNGVIVNPGEGSVVVRALDAATHQPVMGVTATVAPTATSDPFYDGATATAWNQNATGPQGITWIPGVTAGTAMVVLQNSAGTMVSAPLPIGDLAITFATVPVQ
jgi:hypothetical protein